MRNNKSMFSPNRHLPENDPMYYSFEGMSLFLQGGELHLRGQTTTKIHFLMNIFFLTIDTRIFLEMASFS